MSVSPNYFNGLPVPSYEELFIIQSERAIDEDTDLNPYLVSEAIMLENPLIGQAIQHDIQHWQSFEHPEHLEREEINEFCNGIASGYSFFIGVHGLITLLRSGYEDINEFIDSNHPDNYIITMDQRDLSRVNYVRSGNAIIDKVMDPDFLDDSSDLAFIDAGNYTFEAIRFEALMDEEINNINQMLSYNYKNQIDDRTIAHIEGFKHGIANAIEMFMQVKQEKLIREIENNQA
jgi:hypothetical protein